MKPWRRQFGIWVPDRSLSDERGFISAGAVGAIAGSRRRVGGSAPGNIGLSTVAANNDYWLNGEAIAFRVQASAVYGALATATLYLRVVANAANAVKIGIYNTDSSSAPSTSSTLVGATSAMTQSGAATWLGPASFGTGTLVQDNYYFIVAFFSGRFDVKRENSSMMYYWSGKSSWFTTPPSTLETAAGSGNYGRFSMYATV